MLIPSYCSGAMVMITSLSRRVNANFECWNAWVDLADLAVMAAAGMALARLAADVPAQVVAGMENIAVAPLYAPAPSLPFHWRMARAENQDDESCMSYP